MHRYSLLLLTTFAFAQVAFAQDGGPPESPRLRALEAGLVARTASLEDFWATVGREQSPLVEAIPDRPGEARYTFLWRSTDDEVASTVRLQRTWPAAAGRENPAPLAHLPGSDVWYVSEILPSAARFFYALEPPSPPLPDGTDDGSQDPLNRRTLVAGSLEKPVLYPFVEGPDARASPYLAKRARTPAGTITEHRVGSHILRNERRISIYTPPGYKKAAGRYPLLMVFDGDAFQSRIPTPVILDNLIADRKIPPLVAVFVFTPEGVARNDDLAPNDDFQKFLREELLPYVESQYAISDDPKRHAVAGSSRGGLIAAYTGLRSPGLFGNVISLSGSFWWGPTDDSGRLTENSAWLVKEFARSPSTRTKVFMNVGLWEGPGQLLPTRLLRSVLEGKGCEVTYAEFPGGHAPFNWAQTFPDAIVTMFGR